VEKLCVVDMKKLTKKW